MENSNSLVKRFREVLFEGKWIANTNYKDQLSNLTWRQATRKIGSLHTIAGLTYHVNYYIGGVLNVLQGGALEIRDKYSFDLPEIQSQQDWDKLLRELWTNAEMFSKQVDLLSEEILDAVFVDAKYGNYRRNIEGIIEHSYYHLGQISLIKKMIVEAEN